MELNKKTIRSIFWGVAGCIVLYWILHETERVGSWLSAIGSIFSPFAVGAVMAFILNVPMRAIERMLSGVKKEKARRALAVLLTMLAILLVITGVILLLVPQIVETVESLIAQLPGFYNRVKSGILAFLEQNPALMEWVLNNTNLSSINWGGLIQQGISWLSGSVTTIVGGAFTTVIGLGTAIFNGVLSLVFGLYCLAQKEKLAGQGRRILYAFFPEKFSDETVRILRMTNSAFSNFISGQCLEALILGSMFAVCMAIFGMPYIPLVSVVIAVTALIPIVGAFAGCAIGAFFILVNNPVQAFWFVIMFLVLQQIEGNMIYPKVVGTSIGLPGMWVLVAVAVGGDLMGVSGMLLMIPVAAVLYALLREITAKRLSARTVEGEKLQAQPPELRSHFKENSKRRKEKKHMKRLKKQTDKENTNHE